jgi:hypothetical protein
MAAAYAKRAAARPAIQPVFFRAFPAGTAARAHTASLQSASFIASNMLRL